MSCTVVEKTSSKNAVINALKVRSEIAHRQHVVTDKCCSADRRIITQLHLSINVLDQVCTVWINRPSRTYPCLRLRCGRAQSQNCNRNQCKTHVPKAINRHAKYLLSFKFLGHTGERSEWSRVTDLIAR